MLESIFRKMVHFFVINCRRDVAQINKENQAQKGQAIFEDSRDESLLKG